MNTRRFEFLNPNDPDVGVLDKAADLLSKGRIIVYPTDTTYALGANALDPTAIRLLFDLKGRQPESPMHVIVSDLEMAQQYVVLNEAARIVARRFLPGPLTLILPKREIVPDILVSGRKTLGIRIPSNTICQRLAEKTKIPFTTTSANITGGENPYTIDEVVKQFGSQIDQVELLIDQGPLPRMPPSTLIDLTTSPPTILRQGPISAAELIEVLDSLE